MFEFVDHQPIAIDAQALLGDGWASHIAAYSFEFGAFARLAAIARVRPSAIASSTIMVFGVPGTHRTVNAMTLQMQKLCIATAGLCSRKTEVGHHNYT